jgi:hypothetical protein
MVHSILFELNNIHLIIIEMYYPQEVTQSVKITPNEVEVTSSNPLLSLVWTKIPLHYN